MGLRLYRRVRFCPERGMGDRRIQTGHGHFVACVDGATTCFRYRILLSVLLRGRMALTTSTEVPRGACIVRLRRPGKKPPKAASSYKLVSVLNRLNASP